MRQDSSLQPTPPGAGPAPRGLSRADRLGLGLTLGLTVLGFLLLQLWRPYFFLNDDNLSNLSFLTQMGSRLASGEYPFVNAGVFGGAYDWLRDPALMHLTHPVMLALSLLALTPLQAALVDLTALLHLLTASLTFYFLARLLRERFNPALRPGWMVFLSLSYAFCAFSTVIGSSWIMYLANLASLPLILLGLLQPRLRWGLLWTTLGVFNALLMGHVGPVAFGFIFLSLLAALTGYSLRSWNPLIIWAGGAALALALSSPVWLSALAGFSESERAGGLTVADAALGNFPPGHLLASIFLGTGSAFFGFEFIRLFALSSQHAYALACFAAAWLLPTALFPPGEPNPAAKRLGRAVLLVLLIAVVFVARPPLLSALLQALPVFHALRWPFKELIYVVFLLHVWLALRPWRFGPRVQVALASVGTLVLVTSLLSNGGRPPALSHREANRDWYLSGAAGRYWEQLRPHLPEGRRIVPVISPAVDKPWRTPHVLMAGSNYGGLFPGVVSGYGYSPTVPVSQMPYPAPPSEWAPLAVQGIFVTDLPSSWLREHPGLVAVELLETSPPSIRIRYEEDGSLVSIRFDEIGEDGSLGPPVQSTDPTFPETTLPDLESPTPP
ncbi:MAG: hypothetical protein AAGK14_13885 [Verrucomicrobiota bacterium]